MMKKRILAIATASLVSLSCLSVFGVGAADLKGVDGNSEVAVASAEGTSRALPAGARRINLNVNGRSVLGGRVFNLGGVTYVPMFAFADWLGMFTYSYNTNTATARVTGASFSAQSKAWTANSGRLFSFDKWASKKRLVPPSHSRAASFAAASFDRCPVEERIRSFRGYGYGPSRSISGS